RHREQDNRTANKSVQKPQSLVSILFFVMVACGASPPSLLSQVPCTVRFPTASLAIPHLGGDPKLSIDPRSDIWKKASSAWISKDCTRVLDYPDLKTEVKGFWTDTDVYLLFKCPYRDLNLFLPAQPGRDRDKLWDRDVVEMFLGDDWKNIRHYR